MQPKVLTDWRSLATLSINLFLVLVRHPPPSTGQIGRETPRRQPHITDETSTSRHNTDANHQLTFVRPPGTRSRRQPSAISQPPAVSHGLPSPSRAAVSLLMARGLRLTTCDFLSHDHPPISIFPAVPGFAAMGEPGEMPSCLASALSPPPPPPCASLPRGQPDTLEHHTRHTGQTAQDPRRVNGDKLGHAPTPARLISILPHGRGAAVFLLAPMLTLHGDLLCAVPGPIQP